MRWKWLLALLLVLWPQPGVIVVQRGGAATTPVTQILVGGMGNISQGNTLYGSPAGSSAATPSNIEARWEQIFLAGTLSDLYVTIATDLGVGGTHTIDVTVRRCPAESACADGDGAGHTLACNITGTGTLTCSDTNAGHAMTISDKDRVTIKVASGSGSNTTAVAWSMKWVGSASDKSMILGSHQATNSSTSTQCGGFWNAGSSVSTTCSNTQLLTNGVHMMAPDSSFVVTGLYARAVDPVTSGCRRILWNKNSAVDTSGDANGTFYTDLTDSTTKEDLTGSVSLAQFDTIGVTDNPSSGACANAVGDGAATVTTGDGFNWVSTTLIVTHSAQHFWMGACAASAASGTRYSMISGGRASATSATTQNIITPAWTVEDVVGKLTAAPENGGGTQEWIYNLRDVGVGNVAGTTCTVSESATTCTATPSVAITAGHKLDWEWTVTGTPANAGPCLNMGGV